MWALILLLIINGPSAPGEEHFWTIDPKGEKLSKEWSREGPACVVIANTTPKDQLPANAVEFHRRTDANGTHFWSMDKEEGVKAGYVNYDGPSCFVFKTQEPGTIPLYRFYNGKTHFWTIDKDGELFSKPPQKPEGPACYVYPQGSKTDSTRVPFYRFYKGSSSAWCLTVYGDYTADKHYRPIYREAETIYAKTAEEAEANRKYIEDLERDFYHHEDAKAELVSGACK